MPTRIPWAHETLNPVVGCTPVSEGCANCYAAKTATRNLHPNWAGTASGGKWTGEVNIDLGVMGKVSTWRKPRRIFVGSMSDLFHDQVPFDALVEIWRVFARFPQHTFMVLTKRPARMRATMQDLWDVTEPGPGDFCGEKAAVTHSHAQPLPNVWLGVSAENEKRADERIPLLLETPAAIRFVSVEPQFGPVDIAPWLYVSQSRAPQTRIRCPADAGPHVERVGPTHHTETPRLDWVICGCESGPVRRPFDIAWARSLRDQCQAVGVPFFLKQCPPGPGITGKAKGGVVHMPALDGRVWDQSPERGSP